VPKEPVNIFEYQLPLNPPAHIKDAVKPTSVESIDRWILCHIFFSASPCKFHGLNVSQIIQFESDIASANNDHITLKLRSETLQNIKAVHTRFACEVRDSSEIWTKVDQLVFRANIKELECHDDGTGELLGHARETAKATILEALLPTVSCTEGNFVCGCSEKAVLLDVPNDSSATYTSRESGCFIHYSKLINM
jgi:hypothetical protein